MHRILTFFLGLYWLVQFALLAIASAGGESNPLNGGQLGFVSHVGALGEAISISLVIASGLVAVLFLWLLVTVLVTDDAADYQTDEVARVAFAVATGVMTLCLAAGAGDPDTALAPAIPLHLAALLASYVAVQYDRRLALRDSVGGEYGPAAPARAMALSAAHNSMLSRFSGRPGPGDAP